MKPTLTTFLLLIFFNINSQNPDKSALSETTFKGLEQLDSIVKNYTIFFTGENHNYDLENDHIQLKMLNYLNRTADVQHLIIELGFARGYMLNAYINNDTSYYKSLNSTTSYNYMQFYRALRIYNMGLPLDKRIQVHGVDVERFPVDVPILLNRLLPQGRSAPKELEFDIEVLKSYAYYSGNRYNSYYDYYDYTYDDYSSEAYYYNRFSDQQTIDTLIRNYESKKNLYSAYLKDTFQLFDKVFQSLAEYRKWENYRQMPHQSIYRERSIYENISALMQEYPDGKFYGQFGRCHTGNAISNFECDWNNVNSTVIRLNEGVAKGKTLNIGIFYKADKYYYFENDSVNMQLSKYINMKCTDENILIKINNNDSQFSKYFRYILVNNTCKNNPHSQKTDYLDMAYMLDFGYGQSHYNFDNFNKGLQLKNHHFNPLVQNINIGLSYSEDGFFQSGRYEQNFKQSFHDGNQNYTLKGYNLQQGMGYQARITKHLAFSISGILSFQRFTMIFENDSSANIAAPGFSIVKRYKYYNNSFSLGLGSELRLAISPAFGLFVRGRYLSDLSKKFWRYNAGGNNIADKNSPPLSLSNYSLQSGISFLISDY